MKKKISQFQKFPVVFLCMILLGSGGVHAWQSDNGDGTFTNPVLYADYPDPDIIRVGEDFYMVSTTFVDSPGITVLHSQDLVNWRILSHAAEVVDGPDSCSMIGGTAYRGGFWASSIRYYGGTFYIAVQPTFANGRIYYAANPAGPWNYYQLDRNIYDPGLFFDTDGTGYIICGHGPQSIMTLNSACSAVVSQANNVIDSGGEGSHVVKRGNYYYLFNANPGVWPFQLRCSRATNIFGPWETGHICLTAVTGGHQGAIVDIDDNDNWFGFVHQDSGAVGRMPRLGPVFWENDWPVFGTPGNRDVLASTYTKPIQGKPVLQPPTSDDFSSSTLGLQWQWNHNPDNTRWSLTERPGFLRLRPTQADSFWTARNTLTQKGQGPQSSGIVKLDISQLQDGDIAGFGTLGKVNGYIYVADSDGKKTLGMVVDNRGVGTYTCASNVPFSGTTLCLRTDLDFQTNQGNCSYSADGTNWTSLGGYFPLEFDIVYGTFQGEKYAVFCFNPHTPFSSGWVDVDSFDFFDTLPPPPPRSAYVRIEAEEFDEKSGTQTETCSEGGLNVGYIRNGQYLVYQNINFGRGAAFFQVRTASAAGGGNIELYLDSLTGPKIGVCTVSNTGGWQTWTTCSCPVGEVSGIHNLYLQFTGDSGYLFNINWWRFIRCGDLNADTRVNQSDLADFADIWLQDGGHLDWDGNGLLNLIEFAELAANWMTDGE